MKNSLLGQADDKNEERQMKRQDFIKERTRIIFEMLNSPDENHMYSTDKCFAELDNLYDKIVTDATKPLLDRCIELIRAKKINPPTLPNIFNERIKVNLIRGRSNNPHSFDNTYQELIKYDKGLDDAIEIINALREQ